MDFKLIRFKKRALDHENQTYIGQEEYSAVFSV